MIRNSVELWIFMGEMSRSITLQIPVEIAYQAIKYEPNPSDVPQDLLNSLPIRFTKDIPNSLVVIESSKWLTKVGEEILLKPLNEDSCEITVKLKYPYLTSEALVKPFLHQIFFEFKLLEYGYKAGKEHGIILKGTS
jgi:hypothetical protein